MTSKIALDETHTVDITTAARVIGISRSYAYVLAERGEFPCRVLRVGNRYLVPKAGLNALLGDESAAAS